VVPQHLAASTSAAGAEACKCITSPKNAWHRGGRLEVQIGSDVVEGRVRRQTSGLLVSRSELVDAERCRRCGVLAATGRPDRIQQPAPPCPCNPCRPDSGDGGT